MTTPSLNLRPGEHLTAVRRSIVARWCAECQGRITVGETYHRLSLPPRADWGSGRWWSIDVHAVCPQAEAPRPAFAFPKCSECGNDIMHALGCSRA